MVPVFFILIIAAAVNAFPSPDGEKNNEIEGKEPMDLSNQPYLEGDLFDPEWQGDIQRRKQRMALVDEDRKWPHGKIPYAIDEKKFTAWEISWITAAMMEITENTGNVVTFTLRTYEQEYLLITKIRQGCRGNIGRRIGKITLLNLAGTLTSTCFTRRVLLHELLHVVGLGHEHNRPDRDSYVQINWDNLKPGRERDLLRSREDRRDFGTYGVKYDYYSIMHYNTYAHSKNGSHNTIQPLDPEYTNVIGTTQRLSAGDIEKVIRMYSPTLRKRPREDLRKMVLLHDINDQLKY